MKKKRVVKEPSDKAPIIRDLIDLPGMSFDMSYYLIDKDHVISKTTDIREWGELMSDVSLRVVKKTRLELSLSKPFGKDIKLGFVDISTVFLGLDHGFYIDDNTSAPVLFETMVFGGSMDQAQDRCATWEAAEKMHELMCEKVKHNIDTEQEI